MKFRLRDPQKQLDRQLVKAARAGDAGEVTRLLDAGANVNAGRALFAAAYGGDDEAHLHVLEILISRGAEVDARNSANCTALMGAAEQGNRRAVERLLAAGADPRLTGQKYTPADWATLHGHTTVAALLLKRTAPPPIEHPDEVILRRRVGDRLLEEVYDFAGRERITFVRRGEGEPVEAVTRDGFALIGDRQRLREAFEAYARKGGRIPETEIFPAGLAKPPASRKVP